MAELATAFSDALTNRDFPRAYACLSAQAQIRVIGSTPLSGCTTDPAMLESLFSAGLADVHVAAADRSGAVLLAKAGDPGYAQQYGILLEADGDRIGCVSVYLDTVEAEARQFGNPMRPAASTRIMPPFDVTKAI
jgi:hypothetical protein